MSAGDTVRHRQLGDMLTAALRAVDPEVCVAQTLRRRPLSPGEVTVLALGKAAPAMTRGAARVLGGRIAAAVVVSDHEEGVPDGAELIVSSHPLPDATSELAGTRLLRAAANATGHVLFLISGGGSSLAEVPAPGLDMADIAAVNAVLMRSGLDIEGINTIRCHLSALKGGRLAAAANGPGTTVLLSDVGNRPHLVASGPSVACLTTPADARRLIDRHRLSELLPPAVLETLATAEAPPGDISPDVIVAGDGAVAARAAIAAGVGAGIEAKLSTTDLSGPAAATARRVVRDAPAGVISVLAGETTVEVTGGGRGGRNQEAALAAALAISGSSSLFAAFGTDGVDGPTDAAGAIVDGTTAANIRTSGVDPEAALADNDSHPALDGAGALIRCGPTGTNVADLWLVDKR